MAVVTETSRTRQPPLGGRGTLRWIWRQLTSMRIALILLFLLAIASIPGSLLPQRGINPIKVREWIEQRPELGEWLNRLGFFDVFSSVWFSAVYLLLFISLIGCVVPRTWQLWLSIRKPPPPAPSRLERLPEFHAFESPRDVAAVQADALAYLRGRHWRTRSGESTETKWVAAEKGYLREIGNLVFHLALVGILIAVAVGGMLGWRGNVIVREGTGFSNTLTQYDAWGGGRFVDPSSLPPFTLVLDEFRVEFERGDAQRGAPRLFEADVTFWEGLDAAPENRVIEVNYPLETQGVDVYLVGHGYAPHFVIKDTSGQVVFDDSVPFLPQDGALTSTGVIKIPDMSPQLGIKGLFLPTTRFDDQGRPYSDFPGPDNPTVVLAAYTGDLGLDSGVPQSVYSLDTEGLDDVGVIGLVPGEVWTLPGIGTVEFTGFERWTSLQIAHDPAKGIALIASVVAMLGLTMSLLLRRRRLWVKVSPRENGGSLVQIAGLAKGSSADLPRDVQAAAQALGDDSQKGTPT